MLIGLPSTVPPKSSIAICAAVTEPWPVGAEAGPFMSVSTPILTTSSDTCASAGEANAVAANAASTDSFLANIQFLPLSPSGGAVSSYFKHSGSHVNAAVGRALDPKGEY